MSEATFEKVTEQDHLRLCIFQTKLTKVELLESAKKLKFAYSQGFQNALKL